MKIRVVIADDHSLLRQGLRGLLSTVDDICVIAEAEDGGEALQMIRDLEPDVTLLDVRMPVLSGTEVLSALEKEDPVPPTILLTTFDDDSAILEGAIAGAKAFLLKDVSLDKLTDTIRRVAAGETLFGPTLNQRVLKALKATGGSLESPDQLTERELQILRFMSRGFTNSEIADALGISLGTVKNHGSNAFAKLGVRDRTQAVLKAIELGCL